MNLEQKIEAILFYKGEPMTTKELAHLLKSDEKGIQEAISSLELSLETRGIILLKKENEIELRVHKEIGPLIEELRKEELDKELSNASLETLSVILYKEKTTRAEIDYIRGVNSSFILRNLMIRGLIEKEADSKDSRRYFYKPSFDVLGMLGVKETKELTDFDTLAPILKRETAPKKEEEIAE